MTRPYYQDDKAGITIYCGDCREIVPRLSGIDIVFTDPDYNADDIGPNHQEYADGMPALTRDDYKDWCHSWFDAVTKVSSTIVFTPGIANIWNYPAAKWMLCWHKPAAVSFNRLGGYNAWEPILVYGAPFSRLPQDYLKFNTLNFKKGAEREHPCPKPESLWTYLITCMKPGTILDPFLGSGTTTYCAKKLNRKCIGIEISEKYCEIAVKRLAQEVMVLNV